MPKFATVRRGYDTKEVDAFCQATELRVRRELALAENRINVLAEENKRLKAELEELKRVNAKTEDKKIEEQISLKAAILNERINAIWVKLQRKLKESDNRETQVAVAEAEGFFIGAKASLAAVLKDEFGLDFGVEGLDCEKALADIRRDAAYRWLKD